MKIHIDDLGLELGIMKSVKEGINSTRITVNSSCVNLLENFGEILNYKILMLKLR